jgi:hypothetical protein
MPVGTGILALGDFAGDGAHPVNSALKNKAHNRIPFFCVLTVFGCVAHCPRMEQQAE